jgi:hypothetical protein
LLAAFFIFDTQIEMMRIVFLIVMAFLVNFLFSCNSSTANKNPPPSKDQETLIKLDSLKTISTDGDLIVRMNDELISEQVRYFNRTDKTFSHAGIVITKDGRKMVMHALPDEAGADTIRYEPIDSFLNIQKTLSCGLFRYHLSETEKAAFLNELNNYHQRNVRFDTYYDLDTDTSVYCSELIYKSLRRATNDRIVLETYQLPTKMLLMVSEYFKNKVPKDIIEKRQFLAIDNLYLTANCTELMRFRLKHFPGQ